jgi:hypothetical protein
MQHRNLGNFGDFGRQVLKIPLLDAVDVLESNWKLARNIL